jgi:hypothetical protein
MSVGFEKVKVWFVISVMNTLFELMFTLPDWYSACRDFTEEEEVLATGGTTGAATGVVTGATTGAALDWQTEGCPAQVQPVVTWQLTHPAE